MAWTAATRGDYVRPNGSYASDVTDREWALIAPLLPAARPAGCEQADFVAAIRARHATVNRSAVSKFFTAEDLAKVGAEVANPT